MLDPRVPRHALQRLSIKLGIMPRPKVPDMESPAELPAAGVRFQWSKNRTGAGRIRWRSDRRNMVRRTGIKTASCFQLRIAEL
jgi:hypothetical protein